MGVESEGAVASIKGHCYWASAVHSFLQSFLIPLRHIRITLHKEHELTSTAKTTQLSGIAVVLVIWLQRHASRAADVQTSE